MRPVTRTLQALRSTSPPRSQLVLRIAESPFLRRWVSLLSRRVCSLLATVARRLRRLLTYSILGIFLICVFGLKARGVQSPNVMVGLLVFFGGFAQTLAGIMEFVTGNTVCRPINIHVYYQTTPLRVLTSHPTSSAQPSSPPTAPSISPTQ